jgi:hypothetical protein
VRRRSINEPDMVLFSCGHVVSPQRVCGTAT